MTEDLSLQPQKRTRLIAHLLAFITIFIWSTTYVSTKLLLINFTPTEIQFFRLVIAYLALFIVKPGFIKYKNIKEELTFAGAGLCGITLYFGLQNTALIHTTASNMGVLVSVAPFFTAILSYFLLDKQTIYRRFFIGFVAAIIGIALIGFNGNVVLELNPLGDIMALIAALAWAFYSILLKKISAHGYNTIQCTRKIFFYGILFLIPILPALDFQFNLARFLSGSNLFNMLFLGLGASALCFVTWNYAVSILGPVKTNTYIYLSPVITIITSVILLKERITSVAALGVFLILAGLFISEGKILTFNKTKSKKTSEV
ncbi:MAG: DMT family transporter [Anaerovoracaceae bacterium]|jgi:drug/metabolite transporter (DMT)-like permease